MYEWDMSVCDTNFAYEFSLANGVWGSYCYCIVG